MAATLPAIHQGDMVSQHSPMMKQQKMPSPPSHGAPGSARVYVLGATKRTHGKKERDLEQRKAMLRGQMPGLGKSDTSQ